MNDNLFTAHSSSSRTACMLAIAIMLMATAGCSTSSPSAATAAVARPGMNGSCEALANLQIPAEAIGLPTSGVTINSAQEVSASNAENSNGDYCRVLASIHPVNYNAPDINVQVNLPADWNGKSLQFGGGGLNGVLVTGLGHYAKQPATESTPLARGYVTFGSDSGHQSAGGFDGSFYLNSEALENFGRLQIKKTHDLAMRVVQAYYGSLPDYNYFIGGSQGGHEGFDAVQRYPDDYDGVIAGYPAHNVLMLHLSALNYARALQAHDGRSWLAPGLADFLVTSVYARCDDLDGAADGIISNVGACREATADFKLTTAENPLRCPGGTPAGDACLTDAQLEALNVIDSPYDAGFRLLNDDKDTSIFPKWTPFEGSTFRDGGFPNLGAERPQQALQFAPGDATARLAIAQDLTLDVINEFDPAQWAGRITALTPVLSANSIRLDRFRDQGGKLIFFHGTIDDFITPYSSIQYYERLLSRYGQDGADAFVRFYMIPGMGHQTGVFNARLSTLEVLENWVENGVAPGELSAIDVNSATAGRTRPVCTYPQWPRYNGSGNMNQADNFTCTD